MRHQPWRRQNRGDGQKLAHSGKGTDLSRTQMQRSVQVDIEEGFDRRPASIPEENDQPDEGDQSPGGSPPCGHPHSLGARWRGGQQREHSRDQQ